MLVVGEKPTPVAGPGEVLVRLRTSGVNPSDVKKRAGSFPDLLDDGYVIPNSDGAGVIEAVGAGVDPQRVGERVWVYQAQFGRRFGTAAQYVALDALRAVHVADRGRLRRRRLRRHPDHDRASLRARRRRRLPVRPCW